MKIAYRDSISFSEVLNKLLNYKGLERATDLTSLHFSIYFMCYILLMELFSPLICFFKVEAANQMI